MLLHSLECVSTFDPSWLTRISSLNIQCPNPDLNREKTVQKRNHIILWRPLRTPQSINFFFIPYPKLLLSVTSTLLLFSTSVNKCLKNRIISGNVPIFMSVKILILLRNYTRIYGVSLLSKNRQNTLWYCISFIFSSTDQISLPWKAPSFGQFLPHN